MSTQEVAQELVDLCRAGRSDEAQNRLYDAEIVSVEADGPDRVSTGMEAVRHKSQWWSENFVVHGAEVGGPFLNGDQFVVEFKYDVTEKSSDKRMVMHEVGLYSVKDGKVVSERFFSHA